MAYLKALRRAEMKKKKKKNQSQDQPEESQESQAPVHGIASASSAPEMTPHEGGEDATS
jgi:hypothetical protein